jgi:2-oxoglutarate dehydrogenase E1 component
MDDKNPNALPPEQITKVILCAGQVYYDLEARRESLGRNDVVILRTEQLCPWPFKEIIQNLNKYKNASVTWA